MARFWERNTQGRVDAGLGKSTSPDGNPAHLRGHPPEEASKCYVDALGGEQRVLELGREAFARGDYRWVAELVNHVVFANADNKDARYLQADALEQLGYQAENGTWRGFYLMGAKELRQGISKKDAINAHRPDASEPWADQVPAEPRHQSRPWGPRRFASLQLRRVA